MIHAPANVEKNRATGAGKRRVGIVSNLDEPMISKIARAHFLVGVIVRRIFRINHDVAIIIRRPRIIAPNVGFGNLVVWIVASGRQFRIITKHLADLEDSRGRATVAFFFAKTGLILTGQPRAPGDAIFAKQNRKLTRPSTMFLRRAASLVREPLFALSLNHDRRITPSQSLKSQPRRSAGSDRRGLGHAIAR